MGNTDIINEAWRKQAPEVYELSGLELPSLQQVRLPNGITLNVLDRGDTEVCRLGIFVRGGSAESSSQSLAALAASMIREGSSAYPDNELADLFERNGAWIDTAAHSHCTSVHIFTQQSFLRSIAGSCRHVVSSCTVGGYF